MIYPRYVTRVTRLVAHVEQELLTVPEYREVIHVLELGSCISKTHNAMAKRQNTYNCFFWPFCCVSFFDLGFLIIPLLLFFSIIFCLTLSINPSYPVAI